MSAIEGGIARKIPTYISYDQLLRIEVLPVGPRNKILSFLSAFFHKHHHHVRFRHYDHRFSPLTFSTNNSRPLSSHIIPHSPAHHVGHNHIIYHDAASQLND